MKSQYKILIFHFHNHSTQPRLRREYEALSHLYEVYGIGYVPPIQQDATFFKLKKPAWNFYHKIKQRVFLLFKMYEKVYWDLPQVQEAKKIFQKYRFDCIIAHEMETVPLVLRYANHAKVIINLHEYAPKQFEDKFWWKFYFAPFKQYLCKTYLKKADSVFTVSNKIAKQYEREFDIVCDVITNAANFHKLTPTLAKTDKIKLIHHGLVSSSRNLHLMIEMMDYVDARFELDMMLVPTIQKEYFEKLKTMINSRDNINLIEPVAFEDIIPFSNHYDIGIFLVPHSTFNLKYCLPNKFFEFIQSRLMIAIGPSSQMAEIVKEYDLGIIADDFKPITMAKMLNNLSIDDINRHKSNCSLVAEKLNTNTTLKQIQTLVEKVIVGS